MQAVYQHTLPIILIGSAGTDKTVLTLEKMKTLGREAGEIVQTPRLNIIEQKIKATNRLRFINFMSIKSTHKHAYGQENIIPLKNIFGGAAWLFRN
jgi:hypothetical protein